MYTTIEGGGGQSHLYEDRPVLHLENQILELNAPLNPIFEASLKSEALAK